MEYNNEQLKSMYNAYEDVRLSGEYNMFDPNARIMSGLSMEEYVYVMNHYSELRDKFGGE